MSAVCSECACHTGYDKPCSIPGGCGHLHRDEDQAPTSRCLIHRAPKPGQAWRLADPGYRTCQQCHQRIHDWLSPLTRDDAGQPDGIPGLYLLLNATPGRGEGVRGRPGFGSRSPASDHVIAMRDRRSKAYEVAQDTVEYLWDENAAEHFYPRLPEGVQGPERRPGTYAGKRDVWRGGDGKWYAEDTSPVRSVPHTLASWAELVAEERDVKPGTGGVADLCAWLDRHLDWISRQEWVTDFADDLRQLHAQLKTATGDGKPSPVGHCIELLDTGECGAPIFMPRGEKPRAPDEPIRDLPELRCGSCGSTYTGRRLILLKLNGEKRAS